MSLATAAEVPVLVDYMRATRLDEIARHDDELVSSARAAACANWRFIGCALANAFLSAHLFHRLPADAAKQRTYDQHGAKAARAQPHFAPRPPFAVVCDRRVFHRGLCRGRQRLAGNVRRASMLPKPHRVSRVGRRARRPASRRCRSSVDYYAASMRLSTLLDSLGLDEVEIAALFHLFALRCASQLFGKRRSDELRAQMSALFTQLQRQCEQKSGDEASVRMGSTILIVDSLEVCLFSLRVKVFMLVASCRFVQKLFDHVGAQRPRSSRFEMSRICSLHSQPKVESIIDNKQLLSTIYDKPKKQSKPVVGRSLRSFGGGDCCCSSVYQLQVCLRKSRNCVNKTLVMNRSFVRFISTR